ncbi:MAG: hypothetical protein NTW21_17590 [Verrucomicrobia bacterium]|nr:hypothetical protein [Verrucomicrobiota bacterium]
MHAKPTRNFLATSIIRIAFASLALPAFASEIRWSVQGTVSSVGAGFAATVGDPVLVRFSYDSGATTANMLDGLWDRFGSLIYARTEFYGAISLAMEVRIGTNIWSGRVSTSPINGTFALLTVAYEGSGSPDTFTVLASSADSGTFDPFPYTGSATSRNIQVILKDDTVPTGFLTPALLPAANTLVSEITSGTGSVSAGTTRISFTLNPASVTVARIEPDFQLKLTRTLTGIELRWPSVTGSSYRLEESDALAAWEPLGTSYPGTGGEIVVVLDPFNDHPQRRFYRVVKE